MPSGLGSINFSHAGSPTWDHLWFAKIAAQPQV